MPISRQARWMRRAISPRLAMRIFLNMVARAAPYSRFEQRLAELDRLAVLAQDAAIGAAKSASISFMIFMASMMQTGSPSLTTLPTSTKALAPGAGRAVEGADHRRLDDAAPTAGASTGAAATAGANGVRPGGRRWVPPLWAAITMGCRP
jgi:hypothetical protein